MGPSPGQAQGWGLREAGLAGGAAGPQGLPQGLGQWDGDKFPAKCLEPLSESF